MGLLELPALVTKSIMGLAKTMDETHAFAVRRISATL